MPPPSVAKLLRQVSGLYRNKKVDMNLKHELQGQLRCGVPRISDQAATDVRALASAKHRLKEASSRVIDGEEKEQTSSHMLYQLQLTRVPSGNEDAQIQHFALGPENRDKETKVIMIVGCTGAGKSTLIDAITNHIIGVDFADDFRFRLINPSNTVTEASKGHHASSQTGWVTAYELRYQEGFQVDHNLVIIDTPGYGDTRGIGQDHLITAQIREFFGDPRGVGGIVDHIDAIGFVAKAADARLTSTSKYVFDSILSLFGKDVRDSIAVFATFADASLPPVLDALGAHSVPCAGVFKCNNRPPPPARTIGGGSRLWWDMSKTGYDAFDDLMQGLVPIDLNKTREVLQVRSAMHDDISSIASRIETVETLLGEMDAEFHRASGCMVDIAANHDFLRTSLTPLVEQVPLDVGVHTTTCMNCNATCHADCPHADDAEKGKCEMMDARGNCTQCSKRCHWTLHRNVPYIIKRTFTFESSANDAKRLAYEGAIRNLCGHARAFAGQRLRLDTLWDELGGIARNVRVASDRLNKVSVADGFCSCMDYLLHAQLHVHVCV